MKITRYFQSCLLIEEGNARILIDPSAQETERLAGLGKVDAVFYTHEHGDHFDADLAQKLADSGVALYANASTAKQMKSQPTILEDGKEYNVAGVKVQVRELPHCLLSDGSNGPQNTGLVIAGKLFHPGDGKELAGLSVDNVALPITGPDISLKDANDFAKQLSAKLVLPIHYDFIGTKPEVFDMLGGQQKPFEVRILKLGESTEI